MRGGAPARPKRRRPRRPPSRPLALGLVIGELALVALFAYLGLDAPVFELEAGAAGVGACSGVLALGLVSRRGAAPETSEPAAPTLDVSELADRIGTRVVEREAPVASRDSREPGAEVGDLQLFATLGLPRVAQARATGGKCAIAVISLRRPSRLEAPRTTELPLPAVARAIRGNIRENDVAARYGQDEFILFLDRCDRYETLRLVHRLAASVADISSPQGPLPFSAGVACYPDCDGDLLGLVQRADRCLRQVQYEGRAEIRLVAPDLARPVGLHHIIA